MEETHVLLHTPIIIIHFSELALTTLEIRGNQTEVFKIMHGYEGLDVF